MNSAVRLTAVFFGDSLTRADYLERGFVDILAERWPQVRVVNHGVNGDTVPDLLARVDRVLAHKPDWIWLMVGTNDCGWAIPPEEYRSGLEDLVGQLGSARVVLVTPTTSVFYPGANAPYVAAVKAVGSQHGIPVLDFAAEIEPSDFGPDGLHWNASGHQRLAQIIDQWWKERSGD